MAFDPPPHRLERHSYVPSFCSANFMFGFSTLENRGQFLGMGEVQDGTHDSGISTFATQALRGSIDRILEKPVTHLLLIEPLAPNNSILH